MTKRQLLWIVNHKTLLPAEIPIIRSLGWGVFIPKLIPDDPGYRSAIVSYDYDDTLDIRADALEILNRHDFYKRDWSPTVREIINDNFTAVIATWSAYIHPLSESARHFNGKIIARVFGREDPVSYTSVTKHTVRPNLLAELSKVGDRFIFAQAFDNLAEIEAEPLRSRAQTITVPLPPDFYNLKKTWTGGDSKAIFLCPAANDGGYHQNIYNRIKSVFGDLPHVIFGRQYAPVPDPAVLPYLTDDELNGLYARAPVFPYPHTEPRHLHYSPLEAVVVGTPVLYLKGTVLDQLADHMETAAACSTLDDMRDKAGRILEGDQQLAERVREPHRRICDAISATAARQQWAMALRDTRKPNSTLVWPSLPVSGMKLEHRNVE